MRDFIRFHFDSHLPGTIRHTGFNQHGLHFDTTISIGPDNEGTWWVEIDTESETLVLMDLEANDGIGRFEKRLQNTLVRFDGVTLAQADGPPTSRLAMKNSRSGQQIEW